MVTEKKLHPHLIIYTRYSSDGQRRESCADQERIVRAGLARMGIDHSSARVIKDEAITGMIDNRPGMNQIIEMIENRRAFVLAVDDQSRFSRGINVLSMITRLVFHGGRFISVGESIDTENEGWESHVGLMELTHFKASKDLGRRCRRGIEGRALTANGSAGDRPYGYKSRYEDEDWMDQLSSGKHPRKAVEIDEAQADVVRLIFRLYADEKYSRSHIASELNKRGAPKGRRAWKDENGKPVPWEENQITLILQNRKYIGEWRWGESETIRDDREHVKQIKAKRHQPVISHRPHLRIIDQDLWDRVQHRRLESYRKHKVDEREANRDSCLPSRPAVACPSHSPAPIDESQTTDSKNR